MSDGTTDGTTNGRSDGADRPERLEASSGLSPRVLRWFVGVFVSLVVVQLVIAAIVSDGPPSGRFLLRTGVFLVFPLVVLFLTSRPQVVDRDGVRIRPLSRRVRWADVDHVRRPTRWEPFVVLVLRDGRERTLELEGEDRARDVARIGEVPLRD